MSTNSEEIAILLFNDGDLIKENSLNIGSENWKLVFYDSDHYHILLHIWPDVWVQPLDGDKIRLSSEEIFQAKGKVHEVAEGRLFKLHQNINVTWTLSPLPVKRSRKCLSASRQIRT